MYHEIKFFTSINRKLHWTQRFKPIFRFKCINSYTFHSKYVAHKLLNQFLQYRICVLMFLLIWHSCISLKHTSTCNLQKSAPRPTSLKKMEHRYFFSQSIASPYISVKWPTKLCYYFRSSVLIFLRNVYTCNKKLHLHAQESFKNLFQSK